MKQNHTAYRFVQAILLVLLLMLLPVSALAQETELTTTVPTSHTLHIELSGNGTVTIDGVSYTQSADVEIARHRAPTITLRAANGSIIQTVLWGDEDVTSAVKNGTWTAPEITEDVMLTVTFAESLSPATGDNIAYVLLYLGVMLLLSLTGIILCAARRNKHTA